MTVKPCGRIPLISPWLYRRGVHASACRAAAGDTSAIAELAAAFCTCADTGTRAVAAGALSSCIMPEQADALCRESLFWEDTDLYQIVRERNILPGKEEERALFLFCSGRIDELDNLDTERHRPLLSAGYAAAPAPVRAVALAAARRDGTCSILAAALAGTAITRDAPCWSYREWEVVAEGFTGDGRCEDLWLLAVLAPPPVAVMILAALKRAGFEPGGDDLPIWDSLLRTLPDRWSYPVPPGASRADSIGPAGRVVRLAFSPDNLLLATGSCNGKVTVWRTKAAGPAAEFIAGEGSVRFLALAGGSLHVISGTDDGKVRCWNGEDCAPAWSWEGGHPASALALFSHGGRVFIGDEGGALHVLDMRDGRALHTLPLHPSPVTCLSLSPCGRVTACGHADGTVTVASPGEDRAPLFLKGPAVAVRSVAFPNEGRSCLVIHDQGPPALWDIPMQEKVCTYTGHQGRVTCSAVAETGGWFILGGPDHTLRCWSSECAAPSITLPLYSRHVTACSIAPDGRTFAAGFHDGTIRICSIPDGRILREHRGHKKAIATCAIAPDGCRLATAGWDGAAKLWQLPDLAVLRVWDAHASGAAALAGPSGTLLSWVTEDGIARIIDGSDGRTFRTIDLYTPQVRAAALSPDGMHLAVAGADATLRFWNVRNGGLAAAGNRLATSLRCLQFIPGTTTVFSGGWDGACRFYSATDGRLLSTKKGHTSIVTCCAVSTDGSFIVTGSNDTTIRLWRPGDEAAYAVIRGWRSEVGAVALSPDGTHLAAGGSEGVIRLYRLPCGALDGEIGDVPGTVTALAFTRDGSMLLAGYNTGVCCCFSLSEARPVRSFAAHAGSVTGLVVMPGEKAFVTAGGDGFCRFHALPCCLPPARASISEISAATDESARGDGEGLQWAFFVKLLAARFRGEIGICPPDDGAGLYDIQILG